jgi:hypothetical protein
MGGRRQGRRAILAPRLRVSAGRGDDGVGGRRGPAASVLCAPQQQFQRLLNLGNGPRHQRRMGVVR